MPMDIERIVDRKLIKKRVHYLVVWKGFGEENNTWESRVDLIADGYSNVIKTFEEQRKQESEEGPTSRGRSPGRSTSKSPRNSKSPGRGVSRSRSRSRRSRSRSVSVSRKLPLSDKNDENYRKDNETSTSSSSTATRQRKSLKHEEKNHEKAHGGVKATRSRRRSSETRHTESSSSTPFVSRLTEQKTDPVTDEEEDESVLLRSTIAALAPQVREMPVSTSSGTKHHAHTKPVTLLYEENKEMNVFLAAKGSNEATCGKDSSSLYKYTNWMQDGFIAKMLASGYWLSILSVAAVVSSLVASKFIPHAKEEDGDQWRRWLALLTPIVALLLFFHQQDARASAKWVATGLAWRTAGELLVLIGATPRQFETMVAGCVCLATLSFVVAIISHLRHEEHKQSNATLALLAGGTLALFLSDSWVISTENSALESRVILMSLAVLTIALSPMPTRVEDV